MIKHVYFNKEIFLVCFNPPMVEFANSFPSGPFNTGDFISYTCDSGFVLVGPTNLICQISGLFAPDPPICIRSKGSMNFGDCTVG